MLKDKAHEKELNGDAELAEKLKMALNSRGMKKNVADACGISQQAVSAWFKTGRISKRNLSIVAQLTGHDFQYFMSDTPISHSSTITPTKPEPEAPPRPPVVDDEFWSGLSPRARGLVEEVIQKSSSGLLNDEQIALVQNIIDGLVKK